MGKVGFAGINSSGFVTNEQYTAVTGSDDVKLVKKQEIRLLATDYQEFKTESAKFYILYYQNTFFFSKTKGQRG
jgi:hypothetical protein